MGMKTRIVRAGNWLLRPFGAKIVRNWPAADSQPFEMPAAIQRLAAHRIPVRTIIDIGAASGSWSALALQSFPQAAYLAIEPLQERQAALSAMRRQHGNFDYALCVAGETDGGEAMLTVADDLDSSTVDAPDGSSRRVPVRTLDALAREKGLSGPFLLKFDTHGYEIPILNGARETLAQTSVIIMETYNFKITEHALRFPEMCAQLEHLGFRCYDLAGPMLRLHDQAFWQVDLFFARNDSVIFTYSGYK